MSVTDFPTRASRAGCPVPAGPLALTDGGRCHVGRWRHRPRRDGDTVRRVLAASQQERPCRQRLLGANRPRRAGRRADGGLAGHLECKYLSSLTWKTTLTPTSATKRIKGRRPGPSVPGPCPQAYLPGPLPPARLCPLSPGPPRPCYCNTRSLRLLLKYSWTREK